MWTMWSGRGWVVPGPGFLLLLTTEYSVEQFTGDDNYYQDNR